MGNSFEIFGTIQKQKEGRTMAPVSGTHSDTRGNRKRLHDMIDSDISGELLRSCLKDWDARRSGMRESLPGDRRR